MNAVVFDNKILTPSYKALLENVIVQKLFKKLLTLYGT
jgi:hypothetical protein